MVSFSLSLSLPYFESSSLHRYFSSSVLSPHSPLWGRHTRSTERKRRERKRGQVIPAMEIKMTTSKSSSWAAQKHKYVILKMAVMILATAFAVRGFLSRSSVNSSPEAFLLRTAPLATFGELAKKEKCNLFTGDWVPNPAGPVYTNETCNLIEEHQNCMKNGRPDSGYLYWRWSPRNCGLPQFNAKRFLEIMKDKSWALIGDSISRNHVQSLLCMLSKVEDPIFIYHDEGYKSRGWRFPSYNLTLYVMWSPFLVEAAIFEDINGVSTREIELHLDRLDKKWTDLYKNLDYMIFSTGKWFLKTAIYHENNTALGCHYCPKRNLTELGFEFAYRKSLRKALNFIATSDHKGLIFFRTSTPDHFEGGAWFNGGGCSRAVPFKDGEVELQDLHKILRRIELEEFESAKETALQNGVRLKLLDFMQLSLLRPDGHPGPYRHFYPFAKNKSALVQNDCLHWCLPGPIDSWNDVVMEMVLNG